MTTMLPFFSTILLLAGLASAILLPYFVGHGLATGETRAILIGVGFGVLSAILIGVHVWWVGRSGAEESSTAAEYG